MENKDNRTITFEKAWGHMKTITGHKMIVMDLCFKIGLTKQGLLHDLSKYEPVEFITGARYYSGDHSPNAEEKKEKGYSEAWLHHKGRNKHHFEYWMDLQYGGNINGVVVGGAKMPLRYALEMVCDRIAACKVYHKDRYTSRDPWDYYNIKSDIVSRNLHEDTRTLLEDVLKLMANQGEEKALAYMRWLLKHPYLYEGRKYKSIEPGCPKDREAQTADIPVCIHNSDETENQD